jgi:predicted outer membrane repeat protein
MAMACGPLSARVLYVDAGVTTSGNGSSWSSAYKTLRIALTAATSGDEVRVAQGTYRPDQGSGAKALDRTSTFQLKAGVTCKGGYAGAGQPDPNLRDIGKFETILSGDLKANDVDVTDPCGLWTETTRTDNAYNVVTLTNADAATCLDGLTITGGLETRTGNSRTDGGAGGGGGVLVNSGSPMISQCTFKANAARSGGGLLVVAGSVTLTRCHWVGNYAFTDGGAIHCKTGSMTLSRCVLAGNKAGNTGGAIKASSTSSADKIDLVHCILVGNRALSGCVIDTPLVVSFIPATSRRCIVWDNVDASPATPSLAGQMANCCVQSGVAYHDGGGNLSADPLFATAGAWDSQGRWVDGDYHLRSQAGRWDPDAQTWVADSHTSPCIDAGGLAEPVGLEPFPNGGIVNIGLYGGTPEASKSWFGKAGCDTIVAGDINGDCKVDGLDLALLAGHWLENHEEKVSLKWIRHSGFRISTSSVVIYIDPYQVPDSPHDATFVLCSHSHSDHFSPSDIARVAGPQMQLIGPPDVVSSYGKGLTLAPDQTLQLGSVTIQGVRAYNTNKPNHPKANNWLGFIVEIAGKRLYHAGDTDLIEEMKSIGDVDVAMLPVSGVYAMTAAEAATATTYFHAKLAIPMHWGTIVGTLADAQAFAQKASCPVKVMTAGETISLE